MNFVDIGGHLCITTDLSYQKEANTTNAGLTTDVSISGSMKVFTRERLSSIFNSDGMPNPIAINFRDKNRIVRLNKCILTSYDKLPLYTRCTAAEIEFIADNVEWYEADQISEKLNIEYVEK